MVIYRGRQFVRTGIPDDLGQWFLNSGGGCGGVSIILGAANLGGKIWNFCSLNIYWMGLYAKGVWREDSFLQGAEQ